MLRWMVAVVVVLGSVVARADKLDADLARAMKADHIPGLSFAVVKDGRIVKLGSYGLASIEHRAKVTPSTRFEIASTSKMFIATAIRILADEGKLDLDDPLAKYFEHLPATWKAMRVRHLVAMSAGLPEDWDLMCWCDVRDEYDDRSMLDAFAKLKLLSTVGERHHYSSPAYALLGMIVTKVTGKPFADFVAQRIFAPAGMTESSYNDPAAVIANRADGYRFDGNAKLLKRGFYVAPYMHARADVGILTTPRDLAKWVIALEAGKIVKSPERLFVPFTSDDQKRDLRYAYGWETAFINGHRVILHSGGFRTGFESLLARFPDDHLAIAITTNCSGCSGAAVATIAHHFLADDTRAGRDPDPDATKRLIAALLDAGSGTADPAVFAFDSLTGVEQLLPALKTATVTFKARKDVRSKHLASHGQDLVDYVSLQVKLPDADLVLELYRDDHGIVRDADISP